MYQLMINRKNSKKGFTLVEVIVVLVILAILAAIMIPAMTGWIDEARNKAVLVEARSALLACQTIASENYGTLNFTAGALDDDDIARATTIAKVSGTITSASCDADGQITAVVYTTADDVVYTYSGANQEWTEG